MGEGNYFGRVAATRAWRAEREGETKEKLTCVVVIHPGQGMARQTGGGCEARDEGAMVQD